MRAQLVAATDVNRLDVESDARLPGRIVIFLAFGVGQKHKSIMLSTRSLLRTLRPVSDEPADASVR
jgi:hypothetical protein